MSIESSVVYGPFRLDLGSGQLFKLDVPIGAPLTDMERKVLSVIMSAKGKVAKYVAFEQSRSEVVWYVNAIKKKLGSSFRHIKNDRANGYKFELQTRDLNGRRVHIAGSGGASKNLDYAHDLTRALVSQIMQHGGGFVVSAGGDPEVGATDHRRPQVFDWIVLETAYKLLSSTRWFGAGKRIINIHADEIAESRLELWHSLLVSEEVDHFILPQHPRVGDAVEEAQSRFGDILIAIGGRLGLQMLANRYRRLRKHVVPLDIDIAGRSREFGTALRLRAQALQEHCEGWLSLRQDSKHSPVPLLELTSTSSCTLGVDEVCSRILNLLTELDPPYCIVIFSSAGDKSQSSLWCNAVATPVLQEFGFRIICSEAHSVPTESFKAAALTVIDLTDLDPRCLLQAGAAIGAAVNFIWTAREDTSVPFSEPIFRWSPQTGEIQENADLFREYLTSYFSRRTAEI